MADRIIFALLILMFLALAAVMVIGHIPDLSGA